MKYAVLLALLLAQEPTRNSQDDQFGPVTFWDGDYLVAEVRGRTGTYDQTAKTGVVRIGRVTYYTKPRTADEKSRKIMLEFPSGELDGNKNHFALPEGAIVHMDDGTRIEAQQLDLDYSLQRLTSKKPVKLTKPGVVLTGAGLDADDTMKQMIIPSDGYLEITGRPQDLAPDKTPPSPPSPIVTRLHCAGPLMLRDIPGPEKILMISAEKTVQFERHEPGADTKATADSLVLYFAKRDKTLAPISATARGAITMTDTRGSKATASSLDWESFDDIVRLKDVDFTMKTQRIVARTAVIDNARGFATFTGNLRADVSPEEGQPPLHVTAERFDLTLDMRGAPAPSSVLAVGNVVVDGDFGPVGQRQAIHATGSEFSWDVGENSGRLIGVPFAHVTQGQSLIIAPLLVFEGRSLLVVKGPKRLNLVQVQPPSLWDRARNTAFSLPSDLGARRVEIKVATDHDIRYDADRRLVSILGRCTAQTPEFALVADRLFLRLAAAGGIEEARAFGAIRVSGGPQGLSLTGDALIYRPATGSVEVVGAPRAYATIKDVEVSAPWLKYDQATQSVSFGHK